MTVNAESKKTKSPKRVAPKKSGSSQSRSSSAVKSSVPKSSARGAKVDERNSAWQGFLDRNMVNFFFALVIFGLSLFLCVQILFYTPEDYYVPTTDDYRFIELKPLSDRVYDDVDVADYANETITNFMEVSRLRARRHFNTTFQKDFTDEGRSSTAKSLVDSGNWDLLKSGKYDTEWISSHVPRVIEYRNTDGRFTWVLSVDGKWKWHDSDTGNVFNNNVRMTIFIVRESLLNNDNGMAVDGIVLEMLGK